MSTGTVIRLVAGREITDRVHNRAFVLGTLATLVALLGFVIVPSLFADDTPPSFELAVVGEVGPLFADAVRSAADAQDAEVALVPLDDETATEEAVRAEEVDAALLERDRLMVAEEPDPVLRGIVDQARQQAAMLAGLEEAGVSQEEAVSLLAGRAPVDIVTPRGSQAETEAGFALAFVATVLLFLIVQMNGSTLLTGAIEEKSSRVVEVLLGTVRPWQLLAGKLTGILLLALGQLVVFVGVTLAANAVVGAVDVPPATTGAVLLGSVMLVLGFALYAALYAVAGSMAGSLEDAQAVAGPLGFLVAVAYGGTLLGVAPDPDSLFARVLTFLPPTAPFAVPARAASGAIGGVEVAVAAVVTGLAAVLTVRLAGRLYSAAVLAGGRLTWREVVRAEPVGW